MRLQHAGGGRPAAASALALLLALAGAAACADGQMTLQSMLNHGPPPPDTNSSLRLMTAGQSWIRDGICRTSRSLQHSVTRVSYGIELKNVWASASKTPIATTVSSPHATCGKLLFKTWGAPQALCSGAAAAASWDAMMVLERSAGAGRRARLGGRRATRGSELGRAHAASAGCR